MSTAGTLTHCSMFALLLNYCISYINKPETLFWNHSAQLLRIFCFPLYFWMDKILPMLKLKKKKQCRNDGVHTILFGNRHTLNHAIICKHHMCIYINKSSSICNCNNTCAYLFMWLLLSRWHYYSFWFRTVKALCHSSSHIHQILCSFLLFTCPTVGIYVFSWLCYWRG